MSENTKVIRCYCESEFQDEKYGKGLRVFNKKDKGWRCTVCLRTTSESGD
jgi:hypothetical protein